MSRSASSLLLRPNPYEPEGVPLGDRYLIGQISDGWVVLTGSMSWTGGAAHNSENLNLIASPTIAAAYAGHWNQRLALPLPYTQREDWCCRPEVIDFQPEPGPL